VLIAEDLVRAPDQRIGNQTTISTQQSQTIQQSQIAKSKIEDQARQGGC
jgi:hypothetical protein